MTSGRGEMCATHDVQHVLICRKKKKKKKPSDRRPAAKLRRVYFIRNVMRADSPPDGPAMVEGNQSIFGFLYYDYPGFFGLRRKHQHGEPESYRWLWQTVGG